MDLKRTRQISIFSDEIGWICFRERREALTSKWTYRAMWRRRCCCLKGEKADRPEKRAPDGGRSRRFDRVRQRRAGERRRWDGAWSVRKIGAGRRMPSVCREAGRRRRRSVGSPARPADGLLRKSGLEQRTERQQPAGSRRLLLRPPRGASGTGGA